MATYFGMASCLAIPILFNKAVKLLVVVLSLYSQGFDLWP